jgi:hypothetical protein
MQVGAFAGRGVRRGSNHDEAAYRRFSRAAMRRLNRTMTPRHVSADEAPAKVGFVHVLVAAGDDVFAESAMWPATDDAMQSRELVSMFAEPMKPSSACSRRNNPR